MARGQAFVWADRGMRSALHPGYKRATAAECVIRPLDRSALGACRSLAEQRLGLSEADRIPEWFMYTTDLYGGLTLGAFVDNRLVGYSYALPGFDGRPFLLSCGLAVAAGFESRGIGLALKLAQGDYARRAGYELARWTTNALASGPLRLYLSKLGGRLVRYRRDMYEGVFSTPFPDEVEIEWELSSFGPFNQLGQYEAAHPVVASRAEPSGHRRLVGVDEGELRRPALPVYSVEIPWDRAGLAREAPDLIAEWVTGVRRAMQALISAGFAGTAVLTDASSRRSFVVFARGRTEGNAEG